MRRIGTIVLLILGLALTGLGVLLSHMSSWWTTVGAIVFVWIVIGGGILISHKYG